MNDDKMHKLVSEIKSAAETLYPDMVDFLSDLIRIRSYTGEEQEAVKRTLDELKKIGCDQVWMDSAGNALGEIGVDGERLLYNAHLDTNEVSDEKEWPHPPLEPVIEGDTLFGLGASDCKGGVAAIVYGTAIIQQLHLKPQCKLVVMGATLEEDAEGFALRSLVERDNLKPDAVLLAEATNLSLRRGQRGRCEVTVRTQGKTAHASAPHLGESAILKMVPNIEALESMNKSLPVDPVFGQGNQVITLIRGPHTPNSVPEWCEITIDRRLVPGETKDSVLEGIRAVIQPNHTQVTLSDQTVITHTGLNLSGPAFYPGWLLPMDDPLITTGQRVTETLWGEPVAVSVWKFSTDGAYSAGTAGIPTLGFGPQEEKYVHTPLDQVSLEKVIKAAMFYALYPFLYSLKNT